LDICCSLPSKNKFSPGNVFKLSPHEINLFNGAEKIKSFSGSGEEKSKGYDGYVIVLNRDMLLLSENSEYDKSDVEQERGGRKVKTSCSFVIFLNTKRIIFLKFHYV
jgi:hypothetical protein